MTRPRTALMTLAVLAVLTQHAAVAEPEELLQLRHTPDSLALSKDGKLLLVGFEQGGVQIWDLQSEKSAGSALHGRELYKVCFSPDGKLAATAGGDGLVRILHVRPDPDLDVRYTLQHGSPVLSAAFSPDGKTLAVATWDGKVAVWTLGDKAQSRTLFRGDVDQQAVAWSPDGKHLASGDDEGRVRVFDAASGEERFQLPEQKGMVSDLAFSPSGDMLAEAGTGTDGGAVVLWDFAGRKKLASLRGHDPGVGTSCVTFSPDGRLLASGGGDGAIALWDVAKRERLQVIKTRQRVVKQIVFTPDSSTILWVAHFKDDRKVFRLKLDVAESKSDKP